MTEILPNEKGSLPSPIADAILLEAAQSYLLRQPEPGTITELDDGKGFEAGFRSDVMKRWQQKAQSADSDQFDIDFADIQRKIDAEGAEALIDRIKAERAAARAAQNTERPAQRSGEITPTPSSDAPKTLGSSAVRKWFQKS